MPLVTRIVTVKPHSDRRHLHAPPRETSPSKFRAEHCGYLQCPCARDHAENSRTAARVTGLAPPILSAGGIGFPWPLLLVITTRRRNWRRVGRITGSIELTLIASSPGPIVIQV